ncbi:MAG: PAS domain S-box protein [Rhodomicrobium sp.]
MNSSGAAETSGWQSPMRNSGFEAVGPVPWGTHFCQFYTGTDDLIEVLVPYFRAGLEANEFCIWMTSETLGTREAEAAIRNAVPELDRFLDSGQIEIADHCQWHDPAGRFDAHKAIQAWSAKLETVRGHGFEGVRMASDMSWLKQASGEFTDYEAGFDSASSSMRMLTLCACPLEKCGTREILGVAANHEFVLIRWGGNWQVVQNTAHRRVEREFRKFVSLANHSMEFIATCDMNFIPLYVNEAGGRMVGLDSLRQFKDTPVRELFFPEDQDFIVNEFFPRVLREGRAEAEIRFRHFKTGEPLWMIYNVFLLKGDNGEPIGFAMVSRNISERKQAESALHWSARRNELLSDIAARLLRTSDPQGEVHDLCTKVMNFLGCDVFFNYLVDERTGWSHLAAYGGIPAEQARKIERLDYCVEVCGNVARDGCRLVAEDIPASNSSQTELIKSYGIGAYCCHPLVVQDRVIGTLSFATRCRQKLSPAEIEVMAAVTDLVSMAMNRIRTEGALRASGARFQGMYERALAGIAIVDWEGRIEQCNPAFCALLGYTEDELRGNHFSSIVHPDDREADVEKERLLRAGEAPSFEIESRYLHKAGQPVWVRKIISTLPGETGKPSQVFVLAIDTSERRKAEDALRESEERLRAIVGTAIDAIVVIDEEGLVQSINAAGEHMFGYASSEVAGKNVSMLMPEPQRSAHDAYIASYRRTGNAKIIGIGREVEALRKDGSQFFADLEVSEWQASGKRFFTGIIRDVTERKRRDEKIHLLLSEVNHRSKNMLSLVQAIATQSAATEPVEFVHRFSERIQALAASQDLLIKSEWQGIGIEELVNSQLGHFRDLLRGRIRLDGLPLRIAAPAAQSIGMALHELATNAGKYGALSNGAGQVAIAWRFENDGAGCGRFNLSWTESGGPPVVAPPRRGYGSIVIEAMPRLELDAEVALDYAPAGLRWRLECLAERVFEAGSDGTVPGTRAP